ncbi:hypothetical protein WISP_11889 [Willisornis vidua]|uniref:Uncharacterized protein n=1 Tax=Willisornis vidua TaxID=1566151 RepID=A0ABQ9DWH0_9PASS|nr:hypothetical protein WISP_11889 [Willisornis vidua]
MELLECIQSGAMKMIWELKHLLYEERLRDLDLFSLDKRWLRGDLINAFKYLEEQCQEDEARLCLVVLSNRRRGNGQKLMHSKFQLNKMKNFFPVWVTKLPREFGDSPPLETFKNHLDGVLCDML